MAARAHLERGAVTPALVILAAGLGTRFGGDKQTTPLGPGGATLMEYSIFDAMRSGFGSVVIVVRAEMRDAMQRMLDERLRGRAPVHCVVQEMDAGRTKPWGTAHAVIAAAGAVPGPFVAANADDLYGRESFAALAEFLRAGAGSPIPAHALAGFPLRDTLSDAGPVNRALCETDADGWLTDLREQAGLDRARVAALGIGDAFVSMNLWAFTHDIFRQLQDEFGAFRRSHSADHAAELYLPEAVRSLLRAERARVRVLRAGGAWCGVTYSADAPRVMAHLESLTARGVYPRDLWA
jgi:hypothetical protein